MHTDHGPSGFLVIDKPPGMTSFDVIRRLRQALGIRKLGHSGVLDRPAMGVLVIGAGQATRLFELFGAFAKEYEADVWLGLVTATDDLTGELLPGPDADAAQLSREQIDAALQAQVGEIDQLPPSYSLIKVDGRELYRYALAGEESPRRPKRVRITAIDLLEDDAAPDLAEAMPAGTKLDLSTLGKRPLRRLRIRVACSGGVYVRSIARDAGELLGCGGTLGRLVRTRVGPFTLAAAHPLDELERQTAAGRHAASLLLPLSSVATAETSVALEPAQLALIASGRSIRRFRQQLPAAAQPGVLLFGVTGEDGARRLAAVLTVGETNAQGLVELKPKKVLLAPKGGVALSASGE